MTRPERKFCRAISFFLLLATVACATAALADTEKLRVGIGGSYPPFSYLKGNGRVGGFDADFAMALGRILGRQIVIVELPTQRQIPALVLCEVDLVVSSLPIQEGKDKRITFSRAYHRIPARFVCHKKNEAVFIKRPLTGMRVGVVRGTSHYGYLKNEYGDTLDMVGYGSYKEATKELLAGEIEILFGDSLLLSVNVFAHKEGKGFVFFGEEIVAKKWFGEGAGIMMRSDDAILEQEVNQGIETLLGSGLYKELQDKYFAINIYAR